MRLVGIGMLLLVLAGASGCVSPKLGSIQVARGPVTGQPLLLDPGAVGVTTTGCAASWSYDRPQGQINRASDGAGEAARAALELTTPENGEVNVISSVVGAVAAPAAAVIGGVQCPKAAD